MTRPSDWPATAERLKAMHAKLEKRAKSSALSSKRLAKSRWGNSALAASNSERAASDAADLRVTLSYIAELEVALADHNDLLRSAFTAAQRDAIADVVGTTNYRTLADRAHEVLTKHHAITTTARAAALQKGADHG